MKRFFYSMMLMIFVCFSYSTAKELWNDLSLPDLDRPATCITIDGNNIFLGTTVNGIVRSSDNGRNWDILLEESMNSPVRQIFKYGKNVLYAIVDDNKIFRSFDYGGHWDNIPYFMEIDKEIRLAAINSKGELYVATRHAIYKSNNEGEAWKNITQGAEIGDIHAIGINPDDHLFASMEGQYDGIFKMLPGGDDWIDCNGGLKKDNYAGHFAFYGSEIVYAEIAGKIFISKDSGLNWTYLDREFEYIKKMITGKEGNLVVANTININIYSLAEEKWLDEIDELDMKNKIIDLTKDGDNKLLVVTEKSMTECKITIKAIIAKFILSWVLTIKDTNGKAIGGTSFEIYHISEGEVTQLPNQTTDEQGKMTVGHEDFRIGDELLISRVLAVVFAKKSGHLEVDNIMYKIKIDNAKLDTYGRLDYFLLDSPRYQDVTIDHTTIVFNIIFGLQWNATEEYLNAFEKWIEEMNYYLYDVFDGQLHLGKTAIYNNAENFDNADIRIYASNMVWPNASVGGINSIGNTHIHMPRKWYGNPGSTRYFTSLDDYISSHDGYNYTTIAHELGHYALGFYDEYVYVDTVLAKKIHKSYNYGFMDYQYPDGDKWASEMSNYTRYPNDTYKITAQHYWNGTDCWNDFESDFEAVWGAIFCPINKPHEVNNLTLQPGPIKNDKDYHNNIINYFHENHIINIAGESYDMKILCIDQYGNTLGKTHAVLDKKTKKMYQGMSNDDGKMIIVGADGGDDIYLTYTDETNFNTYINKYTVLKSDVHKKSYPMDDVIEIEMKKANGSFPLVSSIEYNNEGEMGMMLRYENEFGSDLSTILKKVEGEPEEVVFKNDKNNRYYYENLPDNISSQGNIFINASDNDKDAFIIPYNYYHGNAENMQTSYDGSATIYLKSKEMDGYDIAILSTGYLTSRNGLENHSKRRSNVISFFTYPEITDKDKHFLSLAYSNEDLKDKDEESIRIFKWDEKSSMWNIIGGSVDTMTKVVNAEISSEGIYTAFTTQKHSNIEDDQGFDDNMQIYPNPSDGNFQIQFYLDRATNINIEIFDLQGNLIKSIYDGYMQNGINVINANVNFAYTGEYICKFSYDEFTETCRVIILR